MSEKVNGKSKMFELALGILFLISFMSFIFILAGKQDKIRMLTTTINTLNKTIEDYNSDDLFSKDEFEAKKQKKLREDISSYIKDRYSRTSKEVAEAISDGIMKYSKEYQMPPELIVGMIEIESRFNPMAVSSKDARGLMQVMPEWVPKFKIGSVSKLHDIDTGIESGIKVLKIHLGEAEGNMSKALYLYVGKNSEYASDVYATVGYFVTYRAKKRNNNGTNK